ncbi:hypothetical protein [Ruminococcus gauvreauii]|uniref:Phage protein n=1 Tax=Ruminococcus gauvreauii TaxID=438033 RepID=A0ABY5VJT3_9FIRM|nr:hypothetical protein [Ruminococcus gauvreauii]UWP60433.1 hypothetical protein NQ502_05165 [Ruminococcus gauvreauii]
MFDEMQYLELSGEKYPYKCDILVLEKIQEEFGDLSDFDNGLLGFEAKYDENGNVVTNEEGFAVGVTKIPNIKCVNSALYWFIQEGLAIEGKPGVMRDELLRKVDLSPKEMGSLLHEELMRCFARKNEASTQKETNETTGNR